MNKYWDFLVGSACDSYSNTWATTFSFTNDYQAKELAGIIQTTKNNQPLQQSSATVVTLYKNIVVKQDARSLRRRFRTSKIQTHPDMGLLGITGEAVNTLVANKIKLPAHRLLAYQYYWPTRKATIVFENVNKKAAADLIKTHSVVCVLEAVVSLLTQGLERGFFHGDCNLSNLFFDEDLKAGVFIDINVAAKLNCPVPIGLALQLAKLRDTRLEAYMGIDEYKNFALSCLEKNSLHAQESKIIFDQFYGRRLGKEDRENRWRVATKGSPDILQLLDLS